MEVASEPVVSEVAGLPKGSSVAVAETSRAGAVTERAPGAEPDSTGLRRSEPPAEAEVDDELCVRLRR